MTKLRAKETVSAHAVEFQILTAARPSESCSAHMDEIDLDARIWTIPAEKTKAKKEKKWNWQNLIVQRVTSNEKTNILKMCSCYG